MARAVQEVLPIADLFHRLFPGQDPRATLVSCPFHSNLRTPAFHLLTRVNRFKCYGCGERGDVVELVRLTLALGGRRVDRDHAVVVAAKLAGIAEAFSGASDLGTLSARLALRKARGRNVAESEALDRAVVARAESEFLARVEGVRRRGDPEDLRRSLDWLEDELAVLVEVSAGEAVVAVAGRLADFDGIVRRFDEAADATEEDFTGDLTGVK